MKRELNIRDSGALFLAISFIISFSFQAEAQLPDKKMADKYGLNIPALNERMEPAPEWLRQADMITMDYDAWKGHEFTVKDTVISHIVRMRAEYGRTPVTEHYPVETIDSFDGSAIKGVSLISHAPHTKKAFEEAHQQGIRAIPYVHFMDIHTNYADQDVFLFEHPEILLKDSNGKWLHTPMDGSDRLNRFLTCANSPSYWKLSLAYVKKMMDLGADGLFIDNVGYREACYAQNFKTTNPEFGPYSHEHLFPDATQDYAWDRLLQAIRALVKSYGDDKIILLNSAIGTPFWKYGDCDMWESFIYSWDWEGRKQTWAEVKQKAQENIRYSNAGRKITTLSFLNPSRKEIKEDAFWAFSAARLVDFIWWGTLRNTGAESLYKAHLGKALIPIKEINGLAYRVYENGLIALNDGMEDQKLTVILPAGFRPHQLLDLYNNNEIIKIKNQKIIVTVPKKSARVYMVN